jgi:hypothetical protein
MLKIESRGFLIQGQESRVHGSGLRAHNLVLRV